MLNISHLNSVLEELKRNNPTLARDLAFQNDVSNLALNLINKSNWDLEDIRSAELILQISNIMYNNTSDDVLPLDDGMYDRLLVAYSNYNPAIPIGALPTSFKENAQNEIEDKKIMCTYIDLDESSLFDFDLHGFVPPIKDRLEKRNMCTIVRDPISKRLVNTEHKYPELVGTLDKCKFVLKQEAINAGVNLNDPTVKIFERDFIGKHINQGIIEPENITVLMEPKYDGVSIEAEIENGMIISAYSRGDTADNVATDLTPILGGFRFPNCRTSAKLGVKFEAIITKRDMEYMGMVRGKTYKNCRNAIIGLLGSSDAYRFTNLITLVPLSCSLPFEDKVKELDFINDCFATKEYNRGIIASGDFISVIYQVKEYMDSLDKLRPILPFLVDGIVVHYVYGDIIRKLGRENSIDKYSMAIKFVPKKVRTTFLGYTFNIGKSGDVIPMAHFKPCEFLGGIHTKQTIHSYQRFKELNLIPGQQIDIEYRNEVITYVTKPDTEFNRNIVGDPAPFITHCPYCGGDIVESESGKSAKCINLDCPERRLLRVVDMMSRLGFTDFSEETARTLNIRSFKELISIDPERLDVLGPVEKMNFLNRIASLMNNPIPDYRIMSAMGFTSMADEKWKAILQEITIAEIITLDDNSLANRLSKIKSIGKVIIYNILVEREMYKEDLSILLSMQNIISSYGIVKLPKISCTGFRLDDSIIEKLKEFGYDAGDYGVTSDTAMVVALNKNATSGKINKAISKGIPVYSRDEFFEMFSI